MAAPPPPCPAHLIRSHLAPITTLSFSEDNERIYSADSSGRVVITSTRSLRAVASWNAHTDSLLGVQEWGTRIITHGRDNKLHLWSRIEDTPSASSIRLGGSASVPGLAIPTLQGSMDVNSLNYCRFSLFPLSTPCTYQSGREETQALIALPNLVESSLADIWTLPSPERLHAAIGRSSPRKSLFSDSDGEKTGIIMSLHLFMVPPANSTSTSDQADNELHLLCAYEYGGVTLWRFTRTDKQTSVEGVGWEVVWSVKLHAEAIMAMAVSMDNTLALTVSADHLIGRYDLSSSSTCTTHKTKHPGNATIAIRGDGKVCAVGGWDGKIRLYSTRSLKSLGTLEYHKSGCQTLAFANPGKDRPVEEIDEDDDLSDLEKEQRTRWLASGGKDNRDPTLLPNKRSMFLKVSKKIPISSLPLPPATHLLTANLTPDIHTPSVSAFLDVLTSQPTIQRRSRLLDPQCHFSYVSPLPLPFPYQVTFPPDLEDKAKWVEKWLSAREAIHERPPPYDRQKALSVYYPENREQPRELVGLSRTGLDDCLPLLAVGNAFESLGVPSLVPLPSEDGTPSLKGPSEAESSACQELVDVLSGHALLMSSGPDESCNFAPWALRYSGHQFGSWAGQLGDGRAISVLVTPHPSDPDLTYELQLKGAGRTPFSRTADGLAVLRSSIREYLCSEAMHALSIPTTRSLSLISLPKLPVMREREESACVLTRVAPSFLRIGSFEALSSENMFYFGGGQQEAHWDALRVLGEWVTTRVLRLGVAEGDAWGKKLILEVARRNAFMVAGWQAYGFMHGVMNTDNISVLGLTIDYGPYAFMDVFDPFHICNHSDSTGRYAYMHQPRMIIYALRALLNSLSPLIGAESENGGKAVSKGWADDAAKERIEEWRKKGTALVKDEMEKVVQQVSADEYGRLMRKRLALRRRESTDETQIVAPLLNIMQEHKLDFHLTFRKLCSFRPSFLDVLHTQENINGSTPLEKFIRDLLRLSPEAASMDHAQATQDWMAWLKKYAQRIESERSEWSVDMDTERETAAKAANPRFVLRQWLLEEVIAKVEKDPDTGKRVLAKVLHMACHPFEPWGAEHSDTDEALDAEIKEERRYCEMGEKKMLGFQCSCSS